MTGWSPCPALFRAARTAWLALGLAASLSGLAADFNATAPTSMDKWMYPFEFGTGGTRPVAPTFASFDPRFDTRDAEFLLGWDTATVVPTGASPARYVLRRARLLLPVAADRTFLYDPTYDPIRTYFPTNDPARLPDADAGRPVEVFGVGFRAGFNSATFLESSSFGPVGAFTSNTISIGTRNAFAAQYDTNGVLVDVANHVGQLNLNWTNTPFEAAAWAIGTTTNAAPGEFVPIDSVFAFDLDLSDPLVHGYLARSLSEGRLRLMVSSLSPAQQITPGGTGLGGLGSYPQWSTRENLIFPAELPQGPSIELEGTFIGTADTDADGLPDDWERLHFGDLAATAAGDPDADGASNAVEFQAGTSPRSGASTLRVGVSGRGAPPVLEFDVAPGRSYRVERSPDLAGWTAAAGRLTYPAKGRAAWIGETPEVTGFYRVVVSEAP